MAGWVGRWLVASAARWVLPTPEANLYPAKPITASTSTARIPVHRTRRRSRFRSGMLGWKASAAVISWADRHVWSNSSISGAGSVPTASAMARI